MNIKEIVDHDSVFYKEYTVRTYEVDFKGRLNPVVLSFLLQETASHHAATASVDIKDLLKMDKTWMLSRIKIKILDLPVWKETIRVYTWPVTVKGLFAVRDFVVVNMNGDVIALSTSSWLIVDTLRRRPVRVNNYINKMKLLPEIRAIEEFIIKPDFDDRDLNYVETGKSEVYFSDIDINSHLTSMKYIEKLLDNFRNEVRKKGELKELTVFYNSEAVLDDKLAIYTASADDEYNFYHKIERCNDGKNLCNMKTVWEF